VTGQDRIFFSKFFPHLLKIVHYAALGQIAQIFGLGLENHVQYYWYKITFFDETPEDKFEAETISVDYIAHCPMLHGKG
jgi:hypothetical protein